MPNPPTQAESTASPAPDPVIYAAGLSRVFDSGDGVHALDLDIPAGAIFGFIGPSGSGKTTAVRLCTGVLDPTDGEVRVLGTAPTEFDVAMRSRIGYLPQLSVLYEDLSVLQNLDFFASLYGPSAATDTRMAELLDFVELGEHTSKRVADISGGMRRRLSLAATLVHRPDVIFLDEPTAGIDPVLRRKFWDRFRDLSDDGATLFVTTQYVGEAAYCDYVGVLADGHLLTVNTPDGLRREAFGGDVIHVDFTNVVDERVVTEMAREIGALDVDILDLHRVRLTVDEAAVSLPQLSGWLSDRDVAIDQAEEFLPPFDDVFVEIVNRDRDGAPVGRLESDRVAPDAQLSVSRYAR